MRVDSSGNIIYSPSDLTVFMESEYASMMERHRLADKNQFQRDPETETNRILAKKGIEHEQVVLDTFHAERRNVVKIDTESLSKDEAFNQTMRSLQSEADVIFQATLRKGYFTGYADFLIKNSETKAWEVWDTKLARSAKPKFIIQLCCYAEMMESMTGTLPEMIGVILGNGETKSFKTREYYSYYKQVKNAFLSHMESYDPAVLPNPTGFGSNGRWDSRAAQWLLEVDHLSQVANIRQTQVKRLAKVGISTMTQLAESNYQTVKGIGDDVFVRLRNQARLQKATGDSLVPTFELTDTSGMLGAKGFQLLPPASDLDVFFDMEGYPLAEGGLEYLFGATYRENGKMEFADWWAYDKSQEKKAFEGFIDWVYERWQQDRSMHIYHYASYEQTALKRLMGDYASRENQIDNLLRAGVFVDLYQVVRQGLCIGAPSYSIKKVERLYRPARSGDVGTAEDSIVFFDQWIESGEPADWKLSPILSDIRDYNKDDCDSTLELAEWLRGEQQAAGIDWVDPELEVLEADAGPRSVAEELSTELLEGLPDKSEAFSEDDHVTQMLAWLLEFNRRENKPQWWKYFSRVTQTADELFEDNECLAGCVRTTTPPEPVERSLSYEYQFDTNQESKMVSGKRYSFAFDPSQGITVDKINHDEGIVCLKWSKKNDAPPALLDLVPGKPFDKGGQTDSIYRTAMLWHTEKVLQPAVRDFLLRMKPTLSGRSSGEPVVAKGADLKTETVRAVSDLQESTLCIQGPPGCGKTFVSAHAIIDLMRRGKRVGVTSNSHKAIINLLDTISEEAEKENFDFTGVKIGEAGRLKGNPSFSFPSRGGKWIPGETGNELLAGGTSWAFCREDWAGKFDYLFIDEAGQVSIAALVAMAPCASNLVIVGDQMQLEQPIQGTHPGDSAQSIMEYFLHDVATISSDRGILLNQSWRMHPDVCDLISEGVYQGRLTSEPQCVNRVLRSSEDSTHTVHVESGVVYIPVGHEGNSQSSEEEADAIVVLVGELIGRTMTDKNGKDGGELRLEDILFVAPYNMQVNLLKTKLGANARIASVDKFQGQEAPIVILSMCASTTEDVPRGMEFLLSKNRMNVAISRAQSLAIVVASPQLKHPRCTTIKQLELANFLCRMIDYSEQDRID